jgi:hypothetical protein
MVGCPHEITVRPPRPLGILQVSSGILQVTGNSLQVSPIILQVSGTILQVNAVRPRGPQQRMRPAADVLHRTMSRMPPTGVATQDTVIPLRQSADAMPFSLEWRRRAVRELRDTAGGLRRECRRMHHRAGGLRRPERALRGIRTR